MSTSIMSYVRHLHVGDSAKLQPAEIGMRERYGIGLMELKLLFVAAYELSQVALTNNVKQKSGGYLLHVM